MTRKKYRWTRSSPRAWGCFSPPCAVRRHLSVFPTCVGVFLKGSRIRTSLHRSSPRAWGCFFLEGFPQKRFSVFPTCVGVFPAPTGRDAPSGSLPHVRGGVSMLLDGKGAMVGSSPRAWGCFHKGRLLSDPLTVFPTCVGVFPSSAAAKRYSSGLPHVRGGVSPALRRVFQRRLSSPRAWGCFCSDDKHPAGTDSLPHVRGGVSHILCILVAETGSSPRAWGCFRWTRRIKKLFQVFPTCVGVFLKSRYRDGHSCSLPHVRGGVSGSLKFLLM